MGTVIGLEMVIDVERRQNEGRCKLSYNAIYAILMPGRIKSTFVPVVQNDGDAYFRINSSALHREDW